MKTVAPAYHCDLEEFERIQPGQWSPPRSCSLQRHILLFWIINFGCGTIFLLAWRQVAWNDAWRKIERSSRDLNAEWVCLKKPARVLYRMLRMRPRCALQVLEWTLVRKLHGVTTIYIYIHNVFHWFILQQISKNSQFLHSAPQSYNQPCTCKHFQEKVRRMLQSNITTVCFRRQSCCGFSPEQVGDIMLTQPT